MLFGLDKIKVRAADIVGLTNLEALAQNIQELIGTQYAGLSMQVVRRGERHESLNVYADRLFPVASAFKAPVLLYYLQSLPREMWEMDKNSALYNMIVYSHNSATATVLGQVGDWLRQNSPQRGNNLELFNDFLVSMELQPMLSSWGYGSATSNQFDDRGAGVMNFSGGQLPIGNATTLQNLTDFYCRFLELSDSHFSAEVQQAFRYLTSIADLRYLSPLEYNFLGQDFLGKDGYLNPGTFPNLGSTRMDSGILTVDDDTAVVYTLGTFNTTDVLANQIAQGGQEFAVGRSSLSVEQTPLHIREKLPYFFTGEAAIDMAGPLHIDAGKIDFVNHALVQMGRPEVGQIVTVNIFDGTIADYVISQTDQDFVPQNTFPSLVGERLPYADTSLEQVFQGSPYAQDGSFYRGQNGVLYMRRPFGFIPQHTFTTPMIGVFEGLTADYGFGGLDTRIPVPFLAMRSLNALGDGQFSLSSLHSEVTLHAIPQLPTNDPAYPHYAQRETIATLANGYQAAVGHLPIGYDSYWSHGCINVLPGLYANLTQQIQLTQSRNRSVVIVLGYGGITNWAEMCLPYGYNSQRHPLYEGNMQVSLKRFFESR